MEINIKTKFNFWDLVHTTFIWWTSIKLTISWIKTIFYSNNTFRILYWFKETDNFINEDHLNLVKQK